MAYVEKYNFNFFSTRDLREPLICDEYEVRILQDAESATPIEIEAQENPVIINYNNSSDDKLLALRGSECTLNLIATEEFQLEDLYTENERNWLVQILRNGSIIWNGFIIPDGCQESFAFTPYTIQVNAVDGLGLLKNLSFVENDGNFFIGKKTWIEIIYGCLNRLGIPNMDIYTCVNIYEITMTESDANDPLALSYVNAERFLKDDQINPMNCQEVLQAVLQQWTACIIQSEGHWYIYRPNEAALNGTLAFRKYVNGVFDSVVTKNIDVLLGGYSEGVVLAPLYHVNTDQLKMIEKPYKTASISYKYADIKTVDNRLANPTLSGASRGTCTGDPALPCNDFTIPSWTKFGTMFNGFAPGGGIIFFDETFINTNNYYKNDNTFYLPVNYSLRLTIDYQNPDPLFTTDMNFGIELVSGGVTYYLQADGTWATVLPLVEYYRVRSEEGASGTLVIESLPFAIDGNVTIKLYSPSSTSRNIIYTNITAGRFAKVGNQKGEIHTTEQTGKFSFASDTINVFNGDGLADGYLGTIFRSDEETATTLWKRRGLTESPIARPNFTTKPFLRIAVEEIQRMYGAPFVKFEGSIANYFNPLSRFTINLINGKFMPTGLSYDLQANICKTTLTRVSNEEVDLDYTLEPDFGETTKVLVK
jgi:hypothetical protein